MKEQFEVIMTEKIKEVLAHYEPPYSPQAWENFRKLLPVPDFWLKRFLLKYNLWISDIVMIGILILITNATTINPENNNTVFDPLSSGRADYIDSEKPGDAANFEWSEAKKDFISDTGVSRDEKQLSPVITQVGATAYIPAGNNDNIQHVRTIDVMPEKIETAPVMLENLDFSFEYDFSEVILVKSGTEEIPVLKSHNSEKKGKSKIHWPDFNSLFPKGAGYNKFTGPDKVALFYSPEMLISNFSWNLGVSHGFGLSLEGDLRSSVSVSAGISYQALEFSKATVYQDVPESPTDTIIESGNYEYLDIPVLINFKFLEKARSRLWFGTGISSIVFLRQDYKTVNITDGFSSETSSTARGWENVLPFASLNFGLLYRYQFSQRICLHSSLQYKLHLVPLGYNSMKLDRLNFQVGIMYHFGRGN